MPRPSNKQKRRTQIADGLIAVMAKHGYDGASITQIAKAAELTPGLVHYHFKNKQEILLTALHTLVEQHNAALDERLGGFSDDPRKQLEAFIDLHLGLGADRNPEALACWILISGEALRSSEVQHEFEQAIISVREHLVTIIQKGVSQSIFHCEHVEAAASAILAAIQGYFVLAATARNTIPHGSAAVSTRHMALGLLRAEKGE